MKEIPEVGEWVHLPWRHRTKGGPWCARVSKVEVVPIAIGARSPPGMPTEDSWVLCDAMEGADNGPVLGEEILPILVGRPYWRFRAGNVERLTSEDS